MTAQKDDALAPLLAQMGQGDVRAARALTDQVTPMVYAHAFRVLGNGAAAEDVTQDALLRLWKIAPQWDGTKAKVTTWLYQVTANLCIDLLRKKTHAGGDALEAVTDDSPSVEAKLQTQKRHDALQAALMELPDRQRQAVVLRHIEGFSNPQIAEILDLSVDAVESLTARGKRALAKILAAQKEALGYEDEGV